MNVEQIIQVFDPEIHQVVDKGLNSNVLKLESTFDLNHCPVVFSDLHT